MSIYTTYVILPFITVDGTCPTCSDGEYCDCSTGYECRCYDGFTGDGGICEGMNLHRQPHILHIYRTVPSFEQGLAV